MRHFSCDLCGKDLTADSGARFTVRMEIAAAEPRELTEADLDQDQIDAMAELLEELEDSDPSALTPPPACRTVEYDLCPACHRKFAADPLGRDRGRKTLFSKN